VTRAHASRQAEEAERTDARGAALPYVLVVAPGENVWEHEPARPRRAQRAPDAGPAGPSVRSDKPRADGPPSGGPAVLSAAESVGSRARPVGSEERDAVAQRRAAAQLQPVVVSPLGGPAAAKALGEAEAARAAAEAAAARLAAEEAARVRWASEEADAAATTGTSSGIVAEVDGATPQSKLPASHDAGSDSRTQRVNDSVQRFDETAAALASLRCRVRSVSGAAASEGTAGAEIVRSTQKLSAADGSALRQSTARLPKDSFVDRFLRHAGGAAVTELQQLNSPSRTLLLRSWRVPQMCC
jgi:hypothetical protein